MKQNHREHVQGGQVFVSRQKLSSMDNSNDAKPQMKKNHKCIFLIENAQKTVNLHKKKKELNNTI